ncbi:MAG: sensor histidine kinase [Spirochaetota bacterium]
MGYLKSLEHRFLSSYDPENIFVLKKAELLFRINLAMAGLNLLFSIPLHLAFEPSRRNLLIGDALLLVAMLASIRLVSMGRVAAAGMVTAISALASILVNNVVGDYFNPGSASVSRLMETLLLIFMVPPLVTSFAVKRSLIVIATVLSFFVVVAHFLVLREVDGVSIPYSFLVYLPLLVVLGIASMANLGLSNEAIAALVRTRDEVSGWNIKLEETVALRTGELADSNASLEKALGEKQQLMREFQHRVKNSFNLLNALVEFDRKPDDPVETSKTLDEFQRHIFCISELYSLLYETGSFVELRLDTYCEKVVRASLGLSTNCVLSVDLDEVVLPVHYAAPLGLIVTEMVTNSIKYAFPRDRRGRLSVSLKGVGKTVVLEIADNGPGLPPGFDLSTHAGVGLTLIQGLVGEVSGRFSISNGPEGTLSRVEFEPAA